jgi:hypothetical protein
MVKYATAIKIQTIFKREQMKIWLNDKLIISHILFVQVCKIWEKKKKLQGTQLYNVPFTGWNFKFVIFFISTFFILKVWTM